MLKIDEELYYKYSFNEQDGFLLGTGSRAFVTIA